MSARSTNIYNNLTYVIKNINHNLKSIKAFFTMMIKAILNKTVRSNLRFFCTSANSSPKSLLIQQTTYETDDWTNIQPRFHPFIGVNLYQKKNHPLRFVQESIGEFFQNWFRENVNPNIKLPIYRGTDPIEPNTKNDPDSNTFYINRGLVLRTDVINREMKLLKNGLNEFLFVADLYRKCEMDAKHFPVFHRVNVVRLTECETLTSELSKYLEHEQKTVLMQMFNCLFHIDLKFRWVNANWKLTDPSWVLEIYHHDEWHRLSGTGMIHNEIFQKTERNGVAGWEIGIGLEHLAMALFNIFDIRMLWSSDNTNLGRFVPKPNISENTKTKINEGKMKKPKSNATGTNQSPASAKIQNYDFRISYILPQNIDLESFPMDKLCEFLRKHIGDASEKVSQSFSIQSHELIYFQMRFLYSFVYKVAVVETFYHPKYETSIIHVQVIYKKQKNRTKRDILAIHRTVRARAAHNFNLTLRL